MTHNLLRQTRPQQLAEAFTAIARANHYMLGLTEVVTHTELDAAEQILIDEQNTASPSETLWLTLDLALDLIQQQRNKLNER